MAAPTPQTPSANYGTVSVNGATNPIFVELKGNIFLTIIGAQSRAYIDIPNYSGGNYRDNVDVSNIGRAPIDFYKVADTATPGSNTVFSSNGDAFSLTTDPNVSTVSLVKDNVQTMMEQDDNFTHTAPRMELNAITMIQWWDTAGATGKVVGSCLLSRFIGESSKIPQNNGTAPPTYVP